MKRLLVVAGTSICVVALNARAQEAGNVTSLPEVRVSEELIREEAAVGPYQQPEWTTQRRFPSTRVYLQQPPWGVGVEQWWRGQWPRGEGANYRFQEEIEVGLPHRFQLDLYENWRINEDGRVFHHDVATEVRWALADWGKIPLNPTLYGEWKFVDPAHGSDVYELKLLLGEELAPRWHWGFNAVYEQEVGGGRATEFGASMAVSYTVIDEKLSAGVEMKLQSETETGARNNAPIEFDIGPSIQWRPTRNSHVDIVPLFGVTSDSPHVEAYIVVGFDFGPGNEHHAAPKSLQSK